MTVASARIRSSHDADAIIGDASGTIGVHTLKTVQYSATGLDFTLAQPPDPTSPWPKFINKTYSRSINFETLASRVDRICTQGPTPWPEQLGLWMMPHGFLRAAATRHATVEARMIGGERCNVVTFIGDNRARVNGYVNLKNLVDKVETWIDDGRIGDVLFEAFYTDYRAVGDARFPMHIVQTQGGLPLFDLRLTDLRVNHPVNISPCEGQSRTCLAN